MYGFGKQWKIEPEKSKPEKSGAKVLKRLSFSFQKLYLNKKSRVLGAHLAGSLRRNHDFDVVLIPIGNAPDDFDIYRSIEHRIGDGHDGADGRFAMERIEIALFLAVLLPKADALRVHFPPPFFLFLVAVFERIGGCRFLRRPPVGVYAFDAHPPDQQQLSGADLVVF